MNKFIRSIVVVAVAATFAGAASAVKLSDQMTAQVSACARSIPLFSDWPSEAADCIGKSYIPVFERSGVGDYLKLQGSPKYHKWTSTQGKVTVSNDALAVSLSFDSATIDFFNTRFTDTNVRIPMVLEVDVKPTDNGGASLSDPLEQVYIVDAQGQSVSGVEVFFDTNAFDWRNGYGAVIRNPQKLKADTLYHLVFRSRSGSVMDGYGNVRLTLQVGIDADKTNNLISDWEAGSVKSASNYETFGGGFDYFVVETDGFSEMGLRGSGGEFCWYSKTNDSDGCSQGDPPIFSQNTPTTTAVVATGNVPASLVASGAAKASSGSVQVPMYGVTRVATEPPVATYPDFIPKQIWLTTSGGLSQLIYGNLETHKVKAQFANVGDRDADSRPIEVHTYRSKGYKEDQHGDWVHVATNTIQGQNLKKDETHTETATIALKGLTPGIYNYVSCIDHPKTEQNNGGDHQEKHESNNCSTEAVFEVKAGVVNQPNVDLTISQVALNTNPVYANYPMSASLWVRNIGTETPTATSRAAYYVSGPGTSNQWQLIADDEVLASELTPGRDQGESIKSPVPAPSIPGSYQLMACADYLNQVLETNKANNCLVTPFTIQTLPAPILSITKFQDEESCCTTNTGSKIKPNIWVKNSGPVAPATNVQVLYQVSSPVATGNQWVYIGYGIIEPRELPPGKTDEDYMEGSGFTIPKDNAWKLQWHQVRACIKPDGSAPSGDTAQGDICATYQRYSKK